MVQLQTFTTSNNLFLKKCFDNNQLQNRKRKNGKKLSNSFEMIKNRIIKFSGRLLIGQKDSLDFLLLDEFFLPFKKGRNDLTFD